MASESVTTPPAIAPPPVQTSQQQVVYHVYQQGASEAIDIRIPCNLEFRKLLRPGFLALLWAVWVLYLAGISKVSRMDALKNCTRLTTSLYYRTWLLASYTLC